MANNLMMLKELQDFVIASTKNNAGFTALCVTEAGSALNFYRDANVSKNVTTLPYFIAHKFNKHFIEDANNEYMVQFIVGLSAPANTDPTLVDGVYIYDIMDSVEKIADKAILCIIEATDTGVLQCGKVRVCDYNVLITEYGEADSVQAIVTMRFEEIKFL